MNHEGCFSIDTQVLDSRWRKDRVWRKRVCKRCNARLSTFEVTEEELELLMEAKRLQSELDEPQWAVVDSSGVRARDLKHAEAVDLVDKLRGLNDSGLTIVTNAVARRLSHEN